MTPEILILRPLNGVFFVTFALFGLLFLILSLAVRKKSETVRRKLLAGLMIFTFVAFVAYKIVLRLDDAYSAISAAAGNGEFSWWSELPLQLCNINTILIPIACFTKKRPLESFCFFAAPLGALLALLMPCAGFDQYSILLPRMIGYYFTHFMVFFGGIAMWSFGIYRPRYKDVFGCVLLALFLCLVIFGINMLMRVTGVNPHANYFYCVETDGNPVLDLFYSWIPYPFLYMMPAVFIFVPYMLLITSLFHLKKKK